MSEQRLRLLSPAALTAAVILLVSCNSFDHLKQNTTAAWMTVMRRMGLTSSPVTLVDLSKYEITRIGPDTEGVRGIYFSDFVEKHNSNHIRQAAQFRHTSDTLLGDKMMPLSHFSRFYGVENGHVKAGRLDQFADSTTILPVRNKDCGYISKISLKRGPKQRGWFIVRNPWEAIKYQLPLISYYPPDTGIEVYGTNGELIKDPTITAAMSGKIFLVDSLGNAVFINNLPGFDEPLLIQLNELLADHPMGTVLIDNGRYSRFSLSKASYSDYLLQDTFRPDSCLYVVGSLL